MGYYLGLDINSTFLLKPSTQDYVFFFIILSTWLSFCVLFIRSENNEISLQEFMNSTPEKKIIFGSTSDVQKFKILTQFG